MSRAEGVAEVVKCLPSKHEAMSSKTSTAKTKTKPNKQQSGNKAKRSIDNPPLSTARKLAAYLGLFSILFWVPRCDTVSTFYP
jgi:hypothetical protein